MKKYISKINLIILFVIASSVTKLLFLFLGSFRHFGLNAELIVAICFSLFVLAISRTAIRLYNDFIQNNSNQITEEHTGLLVEMKEQFQSLRENSSKFRNIKKIIENISVSFSRYSVKQYKIKTIKQIERIFHYIEYQLLSVLQLNKLEYNNSKYTQFELYYQRLTKHRYENTIDLVEFLNTTKFLKKTK